MKILPNIILFEVCTDSVPRPSKCTKIVGGWGHWGSLQRSPSPLAGLRGPTSKGRGEGREFYCVIVLEG